MTISNQKHIGYMNHELPFSFKPKGYVPDTLILNYVRDKLHFEQRRHELKLRGEDLRNITYSNLKKRKFDVLTRVFTSMANLIFFFECISKYPVLEQLFEDDLKDLLGIRRSNPQHQVSGYIFARLLNSILFVQKNSDEDDFRLTVNNLLQQVVRNKIKQNLRSTFITADACNAVIADFDRVVAWTGELAVKFWVKNDLPDRTLEFDSHELLKSN
jgi:hypothetical protein